LAQVSDEQKNKDPIAAVSYANMEENFEILKAAVDQDGHPFKIIRMPVPDLIVVDTRPGDLAHGMINMVKL